MRFADPLKKIFIMLAMFTLAMPLPLFAQDPKPEEKKDEKKVDEKKPETPPLPLKVAETLKFTVTEGTWMSIDVSPDGKWMTFDMLGDIYTLPIEGGVAKRIHAGMSFESQPKLSPDGPRIAFPPRRAGDEQPWGRKDGGAGGHCGQNGGDRNCASAPDRGR